MIVSDLKTISPCLPPLGLTIGSFDGVHRGHLRLIQTLREELSFTGTCAVLSFKNHPAEVLKHRPPAPLIATPEHKILLLKKAGVDVLLLEDFTDALAQMSYQDFVDHVRKKYPFTILVGGLDARFGKARLGTPENIQALGLKIGFNTRYIDKLSIHGADVSSGRIRGYIAKGNLQEASDLLGRPYSILAQFTPSNAELTTTLPNLCLPPAGKYLARILNNNKEFFCQAFINDALHTIILRELNDMLPLCKEPVEVFLSSYT